MIYDLRLFSHSWEILAWPERNQFLQRHTRMKLSPYG